MTRKKMTAQQLLFAFFLSGAYLSTVSAIVPEFYENYKIDVPKISSFETLSIQTCIHKCQLHNICNIVNAKQKADSKVECVFARVECFEKLEEKMRESPGWQIYKLPVKHCEARHAKVGASNVAPSQSSKTATATSSIAAATDVLPNICDLSQGTFKFKHKTSQKCINYNNRTMRLVLSGWCGQLYCQTPTGYLYNINFNKCMKPVSNDPDSEITLDADCTKSEVAFTYRSQKIFYHNGATELCISHPQADNPSNPNTPLKLRSGCDSTEDKLMFLKVSTVL